MIIRKDIMDKRVFVFEDHATALEAWAEIRRTLDQPPILITLDNHADKRSAFGAQYAKLEVRGNEAISPADYSNRLTSAINYSDERSVREAVAGLRNDEHIDAAIGAKIIRNAFIIGNGAFETTISLEEDNHNGASTMLAMLQGVIPEPIPPYPHNYEVPPNGIFTVRLECGVGCNDEKHGNDDCLRLLADQAIESDYLDASIDLASAMAKAINIQDLITPNGFILDIDLDYFMTRESMNPTNAETFYKLINNALAITVATEPDYVIDGQIEGEGLTSVWLLDELMKHIDSALTPIQAS